MNLPGDSFSLLQNLLQTSRAHNVTQRSGREQSRCVLDIRDLVNGQERIKDAQIDDRIDRDGHRVLGEYLLGLDVERHRAQVDLEHVVDARQHEEQARTFRTIVAPSQTKYHRSFVFFYHLRIDLAKN